MFDDALEFVFFIFGIVISAAAAIFSCFVLWAWLIGPSECEEFGSGMRLKTEYKFWQGCFVTMPDSRVLPESIARDVMRQEYKVQVK
jgi:hypothetical protein